MPDLSRCPQCGVTLPVDAPGGLCPACLLQQGAAADTFTGGENAGAFVPPTISELAAKFPALEILSLVGRGGMGAVYQARQRALDRHVALKILPPDIGQDPAFAERFTREARALARLNHPNIVTLYESGRTDDGLYFFLMEFVDGMNLRQLLHAGRVSPREALAIVPQICDALQFAHDHGIVHRDIKPENILLDRRGRVKVADFGVAKLVANGAEPPADVGGLVPDPDLTGAGKRLGTPSYMAPEQTAHPADVDHRADIYALGVVFYQMLTGELPGPRLESPSRKVRIDVRLDEVVLRALEPQAARRYAQASEMKTQVETIASDFTGRPATTRRAAWWVSPVRVAILLVLAIPVLHFAAVTYLTTRSVLRPSPVTPTPSPATAAQLAQEGWQLWQAQQGPAAIEKFRAALKLAPRDANTWNGLGWASFNAGQVPAAEQAFLKVLALSPDHPAALNGLGQIYLARRQNCANAHRPRAGRRGNADPFRGGPTLKKPASTKRRGRWKFPAMEIATQLALFLENQPGTLAAVCDELAAAEINILALTISDTVDHSVVRMIVSDTAKALIIFEEHGTLVVENTVLLAEIDNKPGSLSRIAHDLAKAGVNIEYAYLATGQQSAKGLMVLRVSDADKAVKMLQS